MEVDTEREIPQDPVQLLSKPKGSLELVRGGQQEQKEAKENNGVLKPGIKQEHDGQIISDSYGTNNKRAETSERA